MLESPSCAPMVVTQTDRHCESNCPLVLQLLAVHRNSHPTEPIQPNWHSSPDCSSSHRKHNSKPSPNNCQASNQQCSASNPEPGTVHSPACAQHCSTSAHNHSCLDSWAPAYCGAAHHAKPCRLHTDPGCLQPVRREQVRRFFAL